jgi:hypothetical protein
MSLRILFHDVLRRVQQPPTTVGRRLLLFYSGLAVIGAGLASLLPDVRVLLTSDRLAAMADGAGGMGQSAARPALVSTLRGDLQMLLGMLVALVLMVPTAWVYTGTRRSRGYEQSVVHTILMLPLAVAGIVMVVQNSLALAFSLAGVVAAVRFRSTLKDTSDMLFIFLAIAVGIAVGVQAVTAAAILSATFNLVTVAVWQCGYESCPLSGQEHSHGPARVTPLATVPANEAEGRDGDKRKKRRFDAILSVQALELKPARRAVEEVLATEAKRWQIDEITPKKSGKTVIKYVVRLDADKQPELVLDTLLSRGAPHVVGATLR